MENNYLHIAFFFFGIGALVALWYFGWREYYLEKYRQSLFTLRDDLFDLARKGEMSFNDPLYGKMRDALHLKIRYAHRLTIYDALMNRLISKVISHKPRDFFQERIDEISKLKNAELKDQLLFIENMAIELSAIYYIDSMAFVKFIAFPVWVIVRLLSLISSRVSLHIFAPCEKLLVKLFTPRAIDASNATEDNNERNLLKIA